MSDNIPVAIVTRDTWPERWTQKLLKAFSAAGMQASMWNPEDPTDGFDYVMTWKPPQGALGQFKHLKAILSFGAGVDHIFADTSLPQGVPVIKGATEDLAQRMTEYIVMSCLMLHRRMPDYKNQQKYHLWREFGQKTADEVTIGLLGYGWLAEAATPALQMLGFNVQGWSRTPREVEGVKSFHGADQREAFMNSTDILVCLLPLTGETRGMLNREFLSALPKGASLVQVGRGGQLVERDLLALLEDGHLRHAIVDVFAAEPLPENSALWDHPKLTITPHTAAATEPRALAKHVRAEIDLIEAGKASPHQVDTSRGY